MESYDKRMEERSEPESIDKDIIRRWYRDQCDPYTQEVLPEAPTALKITLAEVIFIFL